MLSRKNKVRKPEPPPLGTVTTEAAKKPTPVIMEVDLTSSIDDKNIAPIQHGKGTSSGGDRKFNFEKTTASAKAGALKERLNFEGQQVQAAGTSASTAKLVRNAKKSSGDEDSSSGYVNKAKYGISGNPGSRANEATRRKAEISLEIESPSKKKAKNEDSDFNQNNGLSEYGTDQTDGIGIIGKIGVMKVPKSFAERRALDKIEKSLDILGVSEDGDGDSSDDELLEPPTKKEKHGEDNTETELSQRSALIRDIKHHDVCIGRLRKLSRAYLTMDGKGPRAYWETWEPPPGWTDDLELINARPEPPEPMSPAYEMAQILKSRPRRSSSAIRRRREEVSRARMALRDEKLRKEEIRAKNKPPIQPTKTKINFFSKPLPTSSDEEAEAEEARQAAMESVQRTEIEETSTGTEDEEALDLDDRLLVSSTQKLENDYQNNIVSRSSSTNLSSNQMRIITSLPETPEKRGTSSSSYSQIVPTRPIENVRRRLWDGNVVSSSNTQNWKVDATKNSKIVTKPKTADPPSTISTSKVAIAPTSSTTSQVDKSTDRGLVIPGSMEDDKDGDDILSQLEIPQYSDLPIKDNSDTIKTESSSAVSPFDDDDDDCGFDFLQALDQLEENELIRITTSSGEPRSSGST